MSATIPSRPPTSSATTLPPPGSTGSEFPTVFGRNLIGELRNFAHRPYLVVTMDDLWPKFEHHFDSNLAAVHSVTTLDLDAVTAAADALPKIGSVIGIGGGQASDVAKFFAWSRGVPLFQVPTAMTTNAPFGHRSLMRSEGKAIAIGYAVPEAVYVDYDVIRSAPPLLNRSGVCDVLCYHTAHYDWKLTHNLGREEPQWPYDERLVTEARKSHDSVVAAIDEIRDVTDDGIRTLMLAHRWGGAAFHNAGWNARHMDGVDHAFLYCLEYVTGKHFIHGQAVGLGLYIGSELQENEAEETLARLHRVGVDIRPEAMGVSWEDAETAMRRLAWYVRYADFWYTVADVKPVTDELVERVKERLYGTYGAWSA
jgi:glycerol dehydrogenase-like iron-containing ADH family enzyme